jgi:predicted ATPase
VTTALLAAERPAGVRIETLGDYRLRDVTEPQTIGQLEHADLPRTFPPLRTPLAEVTNLPNALTTFVGRAAEITDIRRRIRDHRLVTITGPGGAGKTRLAYEAAGDAGPDFLDGVWVAELAAVSDETGVARVLAGAVGIPFDETQGLRSCIAALRDKRFLLVLDNCEHLVDVAAELADALRRSCPAIHVLATSREALRVDGEQVWPVPPMGGTAVRLFADRAVLARPSFEVSSENEDAVRRICERLDGLPLAIELAAARVTTLSVPEIEGGLDDRFRLLRRGARTALPRQQTLQALVDWSHDLLTTDERRVFRRLGTFAGSFTAERAAAVVGNAALSEEGLEQLVAKSLVAREDGPGDTTRFRLLETLREYAVDRLEESGEAGEIRAAHLRAVAGFAHDARSRLLGPEQRLWLDLLDAEWPDLRRCLTDGLELDPATVLDAVGALGPFFAIRGHVGPGRSILERALAVVPNVADRADDPDGWTARVRALAAAGILARAANDLEAAGRHHREQLEIVRGDPDEELAAMALSSLGNVVLLEGNLDEARRLCEDSLAIRRRLATPRPLALALNNLGVLADAAGDYPAAEAAYTEHLEIMRELGDHRVVGQTLTNLALVHLATGRLDEASAALEESLELLRSVGDTRSVAVSTAVHAGLRRSRGDLDGAIAEYQEAIRVLDDLGDLAGIGMALDGIATVLALGGGDADLVDAARLLGASSRLPIGPGERGRGEDEEVARATARARSALGDAVFDAAFGAGAAAELAVVVAEAIRSWSPRPTTRADAGPTDSGS